MRASIPYNINQQQKKAMRREINTQISDSMKELIKDIDSIVLWELYTQLGFRKKRLKKFYKNFSIRLKELEKRYQLDETDNPWLCRQMLKNNGIDFESWDDDMFKVDFNAK